MFRKFAIALLLVAALTVGATAIVGVANAQSAACVVEVDC
jgi:hypothetical protein